MENQAKEAVDTIQLIGEFEDAFSAWDNPPGNEELDEQDLLYLLIDNDSENLTPEQAQASVSDLIGNTQSNLTPEQALERDLATLRAKYSILIYGGRPLVCFRHPLLGLQFQKFEAFNKYHAHMFHMIEVIGKDGKRKEPRKVYSARAFVEDKRTTRYENIVFDPTEKAAPTSWNLWTGFKVKPKQGDTDLFMKLIEALCDDDQECIEYLLNYLAHMVQKPWELPQKAIVMRGAQGIGKGTIMATLGKLTDNFKHLSTADALTGNFNGHMIDAFIVFSDEAVHNGDKAAEGRMKAMITESTLTVNAKGKDVISVRNYIRLFVASNEDWAVPVGEGDRRYFVLDCSPRYKGQVKPGEFFYEYNQWLENGGLEAIYYMLKNRDISEFNSRLSPKTAGRVQLLIKGLNPSLKFIYECLNGTIELDDSTQRFTEDGKIRWFRKSIYKAMLEWLPTQGIKEKPTADDFGKHINKALQFDLDNPKWKTNWKTREDYFYEMPSRKVAMERFAQVVADAAPEVVFFSYSEQT